MFKKGDRVRIKEDMIPNPASHVFDTKKIYTIRECSDKGGDKFVTLVEPTGFGSRNELRVCPIYFASRFELVKNRMWCGNDGKEINI